ncbi:MAG: hypothetical protein RR646_07935 [Erysipelotrichaceae bacterium]
MSFVEDKETIAKKAEFLLNKGYNICCEQESSIAYENERNKFIIGYEKMNNISGIDLCFKNSKEVFSIGWIAVVRSNIQSDPYQKLENILKLLKYISDNYDKIVDLPYCLESMDLVEKIVSRL